MSQIADKAVAGSPTDAGGAAPTPPLAPPVGRTAAVGFIWTTAQAIGSKLVSLASQIVLARLLAKDDFGVVGLALTVATFAKLLQGSQNDVLVQRGARFGRWATAAFWMSAALGIVTALLMLAGAPLAARLYHDTTAGRGGANLLSKLIAILALGTPFDALTTVPMTLLQVRLRFRAIAMVEFSRVALTAALSIWLAFAGFGAYSFIIPVTVVSIVRCAALWGIARPRVRPRLRLRRWRYLFRDTRLTFGASVFSTVMSQGDYMALGIFRSKAVVGLYYFAFILSAQAMQLFVGNFAEILFPVLTKLRGEPARQVQAYLESAKLFATLAFPACLLQTALGGPILRILFGEKWVPAIPVFQVLSLAMLSFVVGHPAWAMLQAQGRFRTMLRFSAVRTVAFVIAVVIAAKIGGALSVAVAVLIVLAIFGPMAVYIALRHSGVSWTRVARIYLAPMSAAALVVGAAYYAGRAIPLVRHNDWLNSAFVIAVASLLYLGIMMIAAPRQVAAVVARVRAWSGAAGRTSPVSRNVPGKIR
jgi:PST family polysaccharide transporter